MRKLESNSKDPFLVQQNKKLVEELNCCLKKEQEQAREISSLNGEVASLKVL